MSDTTPPSADAAPDPGAQTVPPQIAEKIAALRDRLHGAIGLVTLSMMALPRYRHLSIAELQGVLVEPLMRDRVALAHATLKEAQPGADTQVGVAIWASVSDEADARIREQIAARAFPVRLRTGDWTSGAHNWLLDVIAPNERMTTAVLANLRQIVPEGEVHIHPMVRTLVSAEVLEKLGARKAERDTDTPLN